MSTQDQKQTSNSFPGRHRKSAQRAKLLCKTGAAALQTTLRTFVKSESADKPGSVVDNHSSGSCVTAVLKQPTRTRCEQHLMGSYLALLRVGFA